MGYSIVQLFEFHNKKKFEVYAFYFGKKNDETTKKISKECKEFIDVSNISDFELINLSKKNRYKYSNKFKWVYKQF